MDRKEHEYEPIELLAKHEEAIGNLYRVYGEKFEEHREFWQRLSDEEMQHAEWIRRLNNRIQDGSGRLREDKLDAERVSKSLKHIDELLEKAEDKNFSSKEALAQAQAIEQSILESKYFDVFEGDIAEITQVVYYLEHATKDHCERVRKALSEG